MNINKLVQQEADLSRQLVAAQKSGNVDEIERIEAELYEVQDQIEDLAQDEYDDKHARGWN